MMPTDEEIEAAERNMFEDVVSQNTIDVLGAKLREEDRADREARERLTAPGGRDEKRSAYFCVGVPPEEVDDPNDPVVYDDSGEPTELYAEADLVILMNDKEALDVIYLLLRQVRSGEGNPELCFRGGTLELKRASRDQRVIDRDIDVGAAAGEFEVDDDQEEEEIE